MSVLPINKLRALYWAEVHMREALHTCKHLFALQSDNKELRHCIYTGIVISYARSFGNNNGLSAISTEFRRFPDKESQLLHDVLLDSRDTIYAHRDLIREGERLPVRLRKEDFQKIEIDIPESGVIEWNVRRPALPKAYLKDIAALCRFQIDRLSASSTKMLQYFGAQKSFSPGRYILGDDFP
jgi:hypothetical protein